MTRTSQIHSILKTEYSAEQSYRIALEFDKFITQLKNVHGDRWEINHVDEKTFEVVIYYPEVLVKNEIPETKGHTIYDLFIKLIIDVESDKLFFRDLSGLRTTFSRQELKANYIHSHLRGLQEGGWHLFKSFCIGTDTRFIKILVEAGESALSMYGLLLTLNSFVATESLAGVPYKKYMDIPSKIDLNKSLKSLTYSTPFKDLSTSYADVSTINVLFEIANTLNIEDLYVKESNSNHIILDIDREIEIAMITTLLSHEDVQIDDLKNIVFIKVPSDKYELLTDTIISLDDYMKECIETEGRSVSFRGQKFYLKKLAYGDSSSKSNSELSTKDLLNIINVNDLYLNQYFFETPINRLNHFINNNAEL